MKILILSLIFLIINLSYIESACSPEIGCLYRQKFYAYVTFKDKYGKNMDFLNVAQKNYKIIYVFENRLVFYKAKEIGKSGQEADEPVTPKEDQARIERVINFEEILLECGSFYDKLCPASKYKSLESYNQLKSSIQDPETACFGIPFFDNMYNDFNDKVAYICGMSNNEIYEVYKFKQFLSRTIEAHHVKIAADRFNPYHGLIIDKELMKGTVNGKQDTYITEITRKSVYLTTNTGNPQSATSHSYSLYNQAGNGQDVYLLSEALAANAITQDDLNQRFAGSDAQCCIYFKGEKRPSDSKIDGDLMLCLPQSGPACKPRIDEIYTSVKLALKNIKFYFSIKRLLRDKKRLSDCNDPEYKNIIQITKKSLKYLFDTDCKIIANKVSDNEIMKADCCQKMYEDEIKMVPPRFAIGQSSLYSQINDCIYKDKDLSDYFINKKTIEKNVCLIMSYKKPDLGPDFNDRPKIETQLINVDQGKSFIEISSTEDQLNSNDSLGSFLELNSYQSNDATLDKGQALPNYIINKPFLQLSGDQLDKEKSFRQQTMDSLWKLKTNGIATSYTIKLPTGEPQKINPLQKPVDSFLNWLGNAATQTKTLNKMSIVEQYSKILKDQQK